MAYYLRKIGVPLFLFIIWSSVCRADIIDGPANIRSAPNGKVLFSIADQQHVEIVSKQGDWVYIEWIVEQPYETLEGTNIKPKMFIFDFGGNIVGSSFAMIPLINPINIEKDKVKGELRGYTREKNLKRLKLNIPPGVTPKLGQYLLQELIDLKSKSYSLKSVWGAPPFPGDIVLRNDGSQYLFSVCNLRECFMDFVFKKNGIADDWFCFHGCITQVRVLDPDNIDINIDGRKYQFVNVTDYKSLDGPCNLDPCEDEKPN